MLISKGGGSCALAEQMLDHSKLAPLPGFPLVHLPCLISLILVHLSMARTKATARHNTGGNAPKRELSSKGGAADRPVARAARAGLSPYPKTRPTLELQTRGSPELETSSSVELQTRTSLERQTRSSSRLVTELSGPPLLESRVSSPGPLYQHDVCISLNYLYTQRVNSIIAVTELLLCVLRRF